MIYLDNAATTKMSDGVIVAMEPYFKLKYGNPSGIYDMGKMAREAVEESRSIIARILGCKSDNIFFTSGGTESDNWALYNAKYYGRHIITSKIEHHAIINKCKQLESEGIDVDYVGTDYYGRVSAKDIEQLIRDDTGLISVMMANNEIGTTEPIKEIGQMAHNNNVLFHTDAVQAFAHIPIDLKKMPIDLMSASSHKFHGPKGVGFLYVKNPEKLKPMIYGGGQEKSKRSGTENVAGIVGMARAAVEANINMRRRIQREIALRDYLIGRVMGEIPYVCLNGHPRNRLPGNANFTIKDVDGTTLVILMNQSDICISAGSACSSGSGEPSHVLKAIGKSDEEAFSTIRITLCSDNTKEEIDKTVEVLKSNIIELRKKR